MTPVQQVREWVAGIDGQGCKHRKDLLLKIAMRPCRPFRRQFRHLVHVNPVLPKLGQQFIFPQGALRRHELTYDPLNAVECLGGAQTIRPHITCFALDLLLDPSDTNLKKLIKV